MILDRYEIKALERVMHAIEADVAVAHLAIRHDKLKEAAILLSHAQKTMKLARRGIRVTRILRWLHRFFQRVENWPPPP